MRPQPQHSALNHHSSPQTQPRRLRSRAARTAVPLDPQLERAIEATLLAAVHAPSPDNNQPWAFLQRNQIVEVRYDRREQHVSDPRHLLNLLSIGMLLTNIELAAREHGARVSADLFPVAADKELVLRLSFAVAPPEHDPKYQAIFTRRTDRSLYRTREPLPSDFWAEVESLAESSPVQLSIVEDRAKIRQIASAIHDADTARFAHKPFHQEVVSSLQFDWNEYLKLRRGIFIKDLRLPAGAALALRALVSWPLVNALARLRLLGPLMLGSFAQLLRSRAIGIITVDRDCPSSYLQSGQLFQQIWLTAERYGISLHPTPSSIVLEHLATLEPSPLNARQRRLVDRAARRFRRALPDLDGAPQMVFRLGYGSRLTQAPIRINPLQKVSR